MAQNARKPRKTDLSRRAPHQDRAKKTVENILAASREILVRGGTEALTIRSIAKAAGISTGLLYDYFPSKQAVLYQIFDERLNLILSAFDTIFEDLGQPLETLLGRFLEWQRDSKVPGKLDLELRNAVDRDARLAKMIRHFEKELSRRYVKVAKAYGSTWSDADLYAMADYMHEIDHVNLKLQQQPKPRQREFAAEMTVHIFYSLLRRCGVLPGNSGIVL